MGKNGYTLRHALLSTYLLKLWLVPPKRPGAEKSKRSGREKKTATRYERTQGDGEAAQQNRNCTSIFSEKVFFPKRPFSSWGLGSPGRGESASRKFEGFKSAYPQLLRRAWCRRGSMQRSSESRVRSRSDRNDSGGKLRGGADRAARLLFRAMGHCLRQRPRCSPLRAPGC